MLSIKEPRQNIIKKKKKQRWAKFVERTEGVKGEGRGLGKTVHKGPCG